VASLDYNLQLDANFTTQEYSPPPPGSFTEITNIGTGGSVVQSVNGQVGPTITFTGGSSGFTFNASSSTITLVSPLTTKGDLYAWSTAGTRLPVGVNGDVLTADSGETTGLRWVTPGTGVGTVTSVSVVTANGLAGTVATATTTPAITLSTTITGVLKGDGTTISAASSSDILTAVGVIGPANGGTGVANNAASTITISGNFATTFTVTNTTGVTLPTTGTLATLAGAEELTNKTLTSSVGKGTWTASGTWTLPAFTLGGTVSGGGNQLNNIIIGTTTPLAGTFTTVKAGSGAYTAKGDTGSIATNTFTTIFTPSIKGRYLVVFGIINVGAVGTIYYGIADVYFNETTDLFITSSTVGANVGIQISGSNVQIKQVSGGNNTMNWSYLLIPY
jgi:hypothetical protein